MSSQPVKLIVLYKPPPSLNNGLTHNLFITEFTDYLERYIATTKQLVLLGDFNIHINKTDDRDAVEFNNLLDQFGLVHHVSDATHRVGHTLDLVLSRSQDTIVQDTHAEDHGFPDHYPVFLRLLTERPASSIHTVCYRKIKSINLNAVVKDMHVSLLVGDHSEQPLDQLVSIYQNELLAVLNKHAPLKTRSFTIRPQAVWYTADIRKAKQLRRRAERLWRKTGLTIHRDIFMEMRGDLNDLIRKTKTDYYANLICENKDNNKKLFDVVNKLLGRKHSMPLPRKPVDILVESFSDFLSTRLWPLRHPLGLMTVEMQQPPNQAPL